MRIRAIQEPVFSVANTDFEGGDDDHGYGDCIFLVIHAQPSHSPSSTQMGTTKSVVFGRVVMGIRARGIDEGADGVAIFYPAKTWALGSTWS